jgi:nitronate monooxygenase
MTIPNSLHGRFRVPAIAAPMFIVSGPELVIATCKSGVAGTFPALNARPAAQLDAWLGEIDAALAAWRRAQPESPCAPHGVNLILHASNERLLEDLATIVKHRVPIVITSLGYPGEVVKAVHAYGGLCFPTSSMPTTRRRRSPRVWTASLRWRAALAGTPAGKACSA